MALDDPAKAFVELGFSRRAAKLVSRLLRGEVATSTRWFLPEIEYSAAPGTLVLTQTNLTKIFPELTRGLVPRTVGMEANPHWANAAAMPMPWLEVVNYELISRARANPAMAATAANHRPRPRATWSMPGATVTGAPSMNWPARPTRSIEFAEHQLPRPAKMNMAWDPCSPSPPVAPATHWPWPPLWTSSTWRNTRSDGGGPAW